PACGDSRPSGLRRSKKAPPSRKENNLKRLNQGGEEFAASPKSYIASGSNPGTTSSSAKAATGIAIADAPTRIHRDVDWRHPQSYRLSHDGCDGSRSRCAASPIR